MQPELTPSSERFPIWVGVDASVKRDCNRAGRRHLRQEELSACAWCSTACSRRACSTRSTSRPPSRRTLLDWRKRYVLRKVFFDPFQMAAVSQRLAKAHVPIEEFPQTVPNLTAATQNLFDLIQSPAARALPRRCACGLAVSRAIIVESSRGWRLDKLKQAHKIDVIVALSMACLAAVRGQAQSCLRSFSPRPGRRRH